MPTKASEAGDAILGVLLAGGLARRLGGGDKCLKEIGGRTLLDRVVERARPQVSQLLINANGDPARFGRFGLPVAADLVHGFAGPLAGVLTGLMWARKHVPGCRFVASFATDTPFLPRDLVSRLTEAIRAEAADIACAGSGGRAHPVFAVWPVSLAEALRDAIEQGGVRKIDAWTADYRRVVVQFSAERLDPFFNVNGPDDLALAEAISALAD